MTYLRWLLVGVVGLSVAFSCPAQGQQYLYNRADFLVGAQPAAVAIADFNGDRRLDIGVSNFASNTVSILLATPRGSFVSKAECPTGMSPGTLVAGDFNGDRNPDIAVANENDGTVSILLGNGDGTFQAHSDYPVGTVPIGIVADDFNNDGKIDLAALSVYDSAVAILLGSGDGRFQVQALIPVVSTPISLASGDFNGDGKLDLIAANNNSSSGGLTVLLSLGDGTFNRVDSESASSANSIAVADFNSDGKLDVVESTNTFQAFLLLGNGNGTFQAPTGILNAPQVSTNVVLAADFNHDGKPDIAAGTIWVLLGKGDGTFRNPVESPSGEYEVSIASAHLNGDGQLDLVTTDQDLNAVDILLGKGNGSFLAMKAVALAPTDYGPDAAAKGDFNGDGKLDLAVAETNYPNGQVSVALGRGDGTFKKPITSPVLSTASNNGDLMIAADFNGDGKSDLALMDDYEAGFQVLLGAGDGTFQAAVDTPLSNTALSLAVGDFDGDRNSDVVVTTNGAQGNPSMNIYLSNGDGSFRSGAQYPVNFYSRANVADLNKDGKADLIAASFGEPLEVFLGNGDGTFRNPISGPSDTYSGGLVVADFNGDGKPDVAVGTYSGIAFLAGRADGTFRNPVYSNSMLQFNGRMVADDFSGDGKFDVATYPPGNSILNGLVVMVGKGDGTFGLPVVFGPPAVDLVAGDFNSDQVGDLALPNQNPLTGQSVVSLYLSAPAVNLFPTALKFGKEQVGNTSPPKNIKLRNQGNGPLAVASITVNGDFIEQDNCEKHVAIGKACTIKVSFKPGAKGIRTGTLSIKDNVAGSPQHVSLSGKGT